MEVAVLFWQAANKQTQIKSVSVHVNHFIFLTSVFSGILQARPRNGLLGLGRAASDGLRRRAARSRPARRKWGI
jgi:hypothetical protein